MKIESRWVSWREPMLQALVSGFIDTLGFVALFGLFTAHITGNLVVAGAQISRGHGDVFTKLLAIPVFVIAVSCTARWIIVSKANVSRLLAMIMFCEAAWLSVALAFGLFLGRPSQPDTVNSICIGMPMVIAMGMRNAAAKLLLGFAAPSTIMTGNAVQLTIDVTSCLSRPDPQARQRIKKFGPTLFGFVVGAALGAGGYTTLGFAALILPVVITLGLAIREFAVSRQPGNEERISS